MTDAASLTLAAAGAATGLVALGAQTWQFRLSGPRIKVSMAQALTTADGHWHLSLDVTNIGRMPVTVLDVGIIVEVGSEKKTTSLAVLGPAMWVGPGLPLRLIDAESATFLAEPSVVALGLRRENARQDAKGYARLATGQRIVSRNRIDVLNLAQIAEADRHPRGRGPRG